MITAPIKFLGGYVINVSCSLGWGGESSNCTITVVNDLANGVKFSPPKLGTACLFAINPEKKTSGYFKFGGILQRWTEKKDPSSGTSYEIVLESPSKILDGVIVVLDKFQGTIYQTDQLLPEAMPIMSYGTNSPTNFINLFAYKENTQVHWPVSIGYQGSFGASDVNSVGYPAYNIVSDITNCMSRYFYTDQYLIGRFGGEIYYGDTYYWLDLSDLNEITPYLYQYRISGDFMDLNTLLKNITDHANYDYLLTIDYLPDGKGFVNSDGLILKGAVIKVHVLSRNTPPTEGAIVDLIKSYENLPDDQNVLQSYSIGKELSDTITQKMIIGDQVTRYWVSSHNQSQILPMWGEAHVSDGNGPSIQFLYSDRINYFNNDFRKNCLLPIKIVSDGGGNEGGVTNNFTVIETNLLEIRCALSSRETWNAYQLLNAIKFGLPAPFFGNIGFGIKELSQLLQGKALPQDLASTNLEGVEDWALVLLGADPAKVQAKLALDARFNAIHGVANSFFGQKFLVKIPGELGGVSNSIKFIDDGSQVINAWDVAESAWPGQYLRSLFYDINSYDETGRLRWFAVYDNITNADYSSFGNEYTFVPEGVAVHNSVQFEKEIIWQTVEGTNSLTGKPSTYTAGFVKCTVPIVWVFDDYYTETNGFQYLCSLLFGTPIPPGDYNTVFGKEMMEFSFSPMPLPPKYIGVPQRSNRYVWGPWFSFNLDTGVKGKLEITQDTTFTPEAFGSVEFMNFNAQTMVNASIAKVYEQETGYIELAEIPSCSLGDRFIGGGPYVTNMSINIGADGMKTTYQFSTWTRSFGAFAKYNIDRLMTLKKNSYKFYKDLRDLYKSPAPKPFNKTLFGKLEKAIAKPKANAASNNIAMVYKLGAAQLNGSSPTSLSPAVNGFGNPSTTNSTRVTRTKRGRAVGQAGEVKNSMQALSANYEYSFSCSMEQLYTPIVSFDQENQYGLDAIQPVRFISPVFSTGNIINPSGYTINPTGDLPSFQVAISLDPLKESGLQYKHYASPTSFDLDPYFNFGDNDFSHVAKDSRSTTTDLNLTKDPLKYCAKTVGLRGPLLLSGWGFDTAGLPVPSSGTDIGNMWTYHSDTPVNRVLWKTGPVDLRWHDIRKVWTAGHEILEGVLMQPLTAPAAGKMFRNYTQAKMKVYRRSMDSYHDTKNEYITITNIDPGLTASSGSYVMVVDVNYEWRPIWISCSGA